MAFWDDTTSVVTITSKKRIARVEFVGDPGGNYRFIAEIVVDFFDGPTLVASKSMGSASMVREEAILDPLLAPHIALIETGIVGLVKELRKA